VAGTAVSSPNVAVVDSSEVGRCAVYSRHNNGPLTLPWFTLALTEESQMTDVGCGSSAPELNTISLDRFEDGFVQK
jgi:hypothetical protein